MRLSGRSHEVATGVAVFDGEDAQYCRSHDSDVPKCSKGRSRVLLATGEPADKAGAYALQGIGGVFVMSIQGSYSNVIGLPMAETQQLLISMGLNTWSQHQHV